MPTHVPTGRIHCRRLSAYLVSKLQHLDPSGRGFLEDQCSFDIQGSVPNMTRYVLQLHGFEHGSTSQTKTPAAERRAILA